jgi:hypothetical protein
MKALLLVLGMVVSGAAAEGQDVIREARRLESAGEPGRAERLLRAAASQPGAAADTLQAFAELLDARGSAEARAVYERLLGALTRPESRERRASVARRLVVLSLAAGDRPSARRFLNEYHAAGGTDWRDAAIAATDAAPQAPYTVAIPGPLESFRRMAAVSEDVAPENFMAALARTVITTGYQAGSGKEGLVQTEYLKLVVRYLSQARELAKLAGPDQVIRVEACESAEAGDLLRALGYRMRGGCGSEVVLETVNASRAFLTIDSGFPLAELEQGLRTNRPFVLPYGSTQVPVLFEPASLVGPREKQADFIDAFLNDPTLARLYLALSKPDPATAEELRKAIPLERLRAFAHVLDFFGGMLEIRDGRAVTPGGARAARAWEELAGVSPNQGARFFERLISRDDGWLASYYDALARLNGPVQDYLTEPGRLRRFYLAVRGRVTSPGPARPVFQSNTDMLLLTARLRLDADGRPHLPGGIDVWKRLFAENPGGRYDERLARAARDWKDADDVMEALFALCRRVIENEPLRIYLSLSELNRLRGRPLQAATAERLARGYRRFGAQYQLFGEVPGLRDETILQFMDTVEKLSAIGDTETLADTLGSFHAVTGLWQILCRQGSIQPGQADGVLSGVLGAFTSVRNGREAFQASRSALTLLAKAAGAPAGENIQESLLGLLAGGPAPADSLVREENLAEMMAYFEAQRLVPLDLLFDVADHAEALARGGKLNTALIGRLAARLANIESPRSPLTSAEKNAMAFGYWPDRHIETQRKLNIRSVVERSGRNPGRAQEVQAALLPLLRDSLVGLNYIYYAPPGAQLLRSSPSFVRSHDFIGLPGARDAWRAPSPLGNGWPTGAGGRLVGSLAGLPYALAQAEQNFLVPTREQALIWGDMVPQLILSAKVPRWWNVTPNQMHWFALHLRYASTLAAEAALDPAVRGRFLEVFALQASPARVYRAARSLERGDVPAVTESMAPSEAFFVAREMLARRPETQDLFALRIRRMAAEEPGRLNYAAVTRAFGTPKPTLTGSYHPELLTLRTFPTLMGYSSRILAESWESNTLHWVEIADELHLAPEQLNRLVPEWTRLAIERIFATHLEDWPAVLKSLRHVGREVRRQWRSLAEAEQKASLESLPRERQP